MGISVNSIPKEIKVILFDDDAVQCNEEQYEEYLNTLDESILELDSSVVPYRFVLKTSYTMRESDIIENSKATISKSGTNLNLTFTKNQLKFALKDIEGVEVGSPFLFEKDKKGFASEELVQRLFEMDYIGPLLQALEKVKDKRVRKGQKKITSSSGTSVSRAVGQS